MLYKMELIGFFEGSKKVLMSLNQTRKCLWQNYLEQNFVVQAVSHSLDEELKKIPVLYVLVSQKYCTLSHVKG